LSKNTASKEAIVQYKQQKSSKINKYLHTLKYDLQ